MININLELSTESINHAVELLAEYQDYIEDGLEQVVDILTNEGAEIAQASYGDWGVAAVPSTDGSHGYIDVMGDMPLIAEFGAGDATLDPGSLFEGSTDTDVFPGSYSMEYGSGEYAQYGSWHFGGRRYTEVAPRMGLYNAKQHIIENGLQIVLEVFGA